MYQSNDNFPFSLRVKGTLARVLPPTASPYLPLLVHHQLTHIVHSQYQITSTMASKLKNVTEFSYVVANEGVNVFDESSAAGKTYQNVIDTVLRQPGARRVYTGVEIEDPSKVWLFLDWESLEDHENYPKTA